MLVLRHLRSIIFTEGRSEYRGLEEALNYTLKSPSWENKSCTNIIEEVPTAAPLQTNKLQNPTVNCFWLRHRVAQCLVRTARAILCQLQCNMQKEAVAPNFGFPKRPLSRVIRDTRCLQLVRGNRKIETIKSADQRKRAGVEATAKFKPQLMGGKMFRNSGWWRKPFVGQTPHS